VKWKFFTVSVVGWLFLCPQACSPDGCGWTKSGFLAQVDQLVAQVDQLDYPVKDERWARFDDQFTNLVDMCYEKYESELTPQEKRHFWAGVARYYYKRFGKAGVRQLKQAGRHLRDLINEMQQ